jgi:hypothetical protein
MLLSFDRTAKARVVDFEHLTLVIELALQHDQLFAAYLAMYYLIRADYFILVHPQLSQRCIPASKQGDAVFCHIILGMNLRHYGSTIYQILSTARESGHDALQRLLHKLRLGSMRTRYDDSGILVALSFIASMLYVAVHYVLCMVSHAVNVHQASGNACCKDSSWLSHSCA